MHLRALFYVPEKAFERIVLPEADPVLEAQRLSRMFCVSREVILRKLIVTVY